MARIRRILDLAGIAPRLGLPRPDDAVMVWGQSPYAPRGEALARQRGAALWRIEDAFLRSVLTGRETGPFSLPQGLLVDRQGGVHFDPARASDLEDLLAHHDFDARSREIARADIASFHHAGLSKYNACDPGLPRPQAGYVLVVDQTRGDASVRASGGDRALFAQMLQEARRDHPDARIVIRSHPETAKGLRSGHFSPTDAGHNITFDDSALPPSALLQGASAVYCLSSQMGFEAILAGHRPVLYGQPFYAGWGLSEDRAGAPLRRGRALQAEDLWTAAMRLAPLWYDPHHDALCDVNRVMDNLQAQSRAWREDRHGWIAANMRLWKRKHMQQHFGQVTALRFARNLPDALRKSAQLQRPVLHWGLPSSPPADLPVTPPVVHVEDGLLRSRGLGAALVPPLSLVLDDLGIYYDPSRPSRLEALIAEAQHLPQPARARADRLVAAITAAGLSKYNLAASPLPPLPQDGRKRILVVGQVEDDASIRLGAGEIRSNRALLQAARQAEPDAFILYKPHPDVEAGLRQGAVPDAGNWADAIAPHADPAALLAQVDGLWTMTSGMGFEALLRRIPVTTTGQPFYAGWGLTRDLGAPLPRRSATPDITALAHAVLIEYPRYSDPVTGLPCPPEVAVARLAAGAPPKIGRAHRLLAKAQGALAAYAYLWR